MARLSSDHAASLLTTEGVCRGGRIAGLTTSAAASGRYQQFPLCVRAFYSCCGRGKKIIIADISQIIGRDNSRLCGEGTAARLCANANLAQLKVTIISKISLLKYVTNDALSSLKASRQFFASLSRCSTLSKLLSFCRHVPFPPPAPPQSAPALPVLRLRTWLC